MAGETAEEIRRNPLYIDNAFTGVLIQAWGGNFLIYIGTVNQRIPGFYLPRTGHLRVDPFVNRSGCQEIGIYPTQQMAEAACRNSSMASFPSMVVYSHYRGVRDLILPTIICNTTAPRLTSTMLAAIDQETGHASQASNLLIEALLTLGPMTIAVATVRLPRPRPAPSPTVTAVVAAPRGVISIAEMLNFVLDVYRNRPILQELRRLHLMRELNIMEVRRVVADFSRVSGVGVQIVRTGEVSRFAGSGNFASLNLSQGLLLIEEQVTATPRGFLNEIIHEISHYYAGGRGEPTLPHGIMKATFFIEQLVKEGEAALRRTIQVLS